MIQYVKDLFFPSNREVRQVNNERSVSDFSKHQFEYRLSPAAFDMFKNNMVSSQASVPVIENTSRYDQIDESPAQRFNPRLDSYAAGKLGSFAGSSHPSHAIIPLGNSIQSYESEAARTAQLDQLDFNL